MCKGVIRYGLLKALEKYYKWRLKKVYKEICLLKQECEEVMYGKV